MAEREKLVIVDGSSYLFRAFHALPPLTTSRGEPTGAIYGVANMLRKLRADYPTEHVVVVFDAPGRTFREDLYEQYKANRPPMPDELAVQIEPLHELVRAMGFPVLVIPGVEADDVIATLARQAEARGFDVIISTGDKDLAQLVTDHVTLVNTMDGTVLDRAGVEEKFGVPPERIVDWLALVGDPVDNIPGVPKVGPKTAARWLQTWGSLDELIAHADEIKGKVGESLRAHLEHLPLYRELATVRCDVELPVDPEELRMGPPDREALVRLLRRLEFRSWLEEVLAEEMLGEDGETPGGGAHRSPKAESECRYRIVLTEADLEDWARRLEEASLFAFDTETTSLDYMQAQVVGVSFCIETGEAAYVPVAHRYPGAPVQLERERVLERLRHLLESDDHPKVGQNLKYDMNVLARHDVELGGIRFDTMLESYVLDSTVTRHDMDSLALKYLGRRTIHYEDVAGKGARQLSFDQVPIEQAGPYAAEDAEVVLRLHEVLYARLRAEPSLLRVFEEIEMPLVPVLSAMERTGVMIDAEALRAYSRELEQQLARIEAQAHEVAGQVFNLGSPKQIQEILYDKLGLPVLARTPKGQPSTAESVLQELAASYELPRLILEYRSLAKLRSTYTEALVANIDPDTGRVHTSYHQAVTSTGRLSSSEPNLQNIPVRTPEGRRIRQAFIAPPGRLLLSADYSQIELRIMAHLSGDEGLRRAFAAGRDIHRATAAEVFGVPEEEVTPEQRRRAKAINFGLIYGMSAFGLARQLGIDRSEAQTYVELYFARYPGVKAYMDRIRETAREQGYVETLFGRRVHIPEIHSRNAQRRQYAERTAINAPMQGTAADIIKRAMIRVHDWLRRRKVPGAMIMQVHDELVFELDEEVLEEVRPRVKSLMEGAAELSVPLVVDTGAGRNWDEAH